MQTILEEFLNFSRPLGSLAREPTDLVELCESVVALHEGLLRANELSIEVHARERVRLPCDARKLKQALINLLQNAIEASVAKTRIDLEIETAGDAVHIRVK